ncbi:MAG: alcohol dehydrogenase catalytic domain-containing protein [Acidimicrobiales bacterium]
MKSVMFTGVGSVETVEVDDPSVRHPADAILDVERSAICGSDLHPFRGEWGDPEGQRPGHEFIGTIVETGPEVRLRNVGERVLCSGAVGCGHCPHCDDGRSAACSAGMRVLGIPALTDYAGGQAEYVAVPAADHCLMPIPEGMSDAAALLLTDNLATGWQGARRAHVHEGDLVAVVGFGPVGMCAALAARLLGAWEIVVVDPVASRRQFATELGFTAFDAGPDTASQVVEHTGGGADAVIESAGRDQSIRAAIDMGHTTARISAVSVPSEPYSAEPAALVGPHQRFVETVASPQRAWPQLMAHLEAPAFARLDDVFSHTMALDDAASAYDLFANQADQCRKVMFTT